MNELEERKIKSLESIADSLSTLAEDTKANRKLRIENRELLEGLTIKIQKLADDPFGLKGDE